MFGLPVHEPPAVHATHAPEPLHTMLVPQLTPADLVPPSTQVCAPVEHVVVPLLQMVRLAVHACPAVQDTHVPPPLQTMLVPQLTPADLAPPSTQVCAPVEHDVVPVRQTPGFVEQA